MERIGSKYGRYKHVSNEASNGVMVAIVAAFRGNGHEHDVITHYTRARERMAHAVRDGSCKHGNNGAYNAVMVALTSYDSDYEHEVKTLSKSKRTHGSWRVAAATSIVSADAPMLLAFFRGMPVSDV